VRSLVSDLKPESGTDRLGRTASLEPIAWQNLQTALHPATSYDVISVALGAVILQRCPPPINMGAFSREDLGRLFNLLSPVFKGPRNIGIYTDETV
jgi:hypothetical protein